MSRTEPRIFYGWYIVLACGVVAFYSWGLAFYGLGVYLQALHARHGWSTSLISGAITAYYVASAAIGLIVGGIVDRRGARPVFAFGAVVMGLSIVMLGIVTAPWQLFAVLLVMSTSLASLSTTTIGGALLPWFNERRGRAVAMALIGSPAGGMVLVPVLVFLTHQHGFGAATIVAALLLWASVLPLAAFVIKRRPEDMGLLPDGMTASQDVVAVDAPASPASGPRWTRRTALRTSSFWMIAVPFFLGFVVQGGFIVHQLTFLEPTLGQAQAAFAVSAMTLVSIAGRLVLGALSDRVDRRLLAAGCVMVQAMALALMATVPSPAALWLGSVTFGLGVGILITLPPLLIQEAFGTLSFGTVFAMVNGAMQVGVSLGPSLVGVLRDRSGGYDGPLCVLAALDALAMVVLLWRRGLGRISRTPGTGVIRSHAEGSEQRGLGG